MVEKFDKRGNYTKDNKRTFNVTKEFFEDGNIPDWFKPVINYGVTDGGVLVPEKVSDEGEPLTKQSGSIDSLAGEKTISTAGSAEELASDTDCSSVTIQAKKSNTDSVYIGDDSDQYLELDPGESISIAVNNLNLLYIDVEVDDEGVNYVGVN